MQVITTSVLLLFIVLPTLSARKHAVVIGIDTYAQGNCVDRDQPERGFQLSKKRCPQETNPNLKNAVSDAKAFVGLLKSRYNFSDAEITFLPNEKARASVILSAFRTQLVEHMGDGDSAIFFFSGHGTRIRNIETLAQQEAIVPYDFLTGTYPILDIELAPLYQAAVNKRIHLAVVLDSCYSGGMARGTRLRTMGDTRTIADPRKPFEPQGTFALLAAAQGDQEASDDPKTFTQTMVEIIQATPWDMTLDEIARLSAAKMSGRQSPIAVGEAALNADLMGQPPDRQQESFLVLESGASRRIQVAGGLLSGLTIGSTLAQADDSPETFVVKRVVLNQAELEGSGSTSTPKVGSRLRLVRWNPDLENAMSVFVPANLPSNVEIDQLRSCLGDRDAVLLSPSRPQLQISWGDTGWIITQPDGSKADFRCGDLPNFANYLVAANVPISREVLEDVRRQLGPYRTVLQDRGNAKFEIVGRLNGKRLEYALAERPGYQDSMFATVTNWNQDWYVHDEAAVPFPDGQHDCLSELQTCALLLMRRIQRYRIAQNVDAAQVLSHRRLAQTGASRSPFSIEVRTKLGDTCTSEKLDVIRAKEKYCVYLIRTGPPLDNSRWYVNLFTIDSAGLKGPSYIPGEKQFPDEQTPTYLREFLITPVFSSDHTEGNSETFFLIASPDPRDSQLWLTEVYQQKPDVPVAPIGSVGQTTARSGPSERPNGQRPDIIWSVLRKTVQVNQ